MSEVTDIVDGHIELFDELREALLIDDYKIFLLSRDGQSEKFSVVKELTKGWYIEFDKYRGQMLVSYATLENNFGDEISQASFVAYGAADADGDFDVYSINPDRRDVVSPDGENPFWKMFVTREPTMRFRV